MVKDVENTNVLVTVFDPENDDDEWDVLELPSTVVEIYDAEMTDILILNLTSNATGNDTFMIADVYISPIQMELTYGELYKFRGYIKDEQYNMVEQFHDIPLVFGCIDEADPLRPYLSECDHSSRMGIGGVIFCLLLIYLW